jgi:hypothetical protein
MIGLWIDTQQNSSMGISTSNEVDGDARISQSDRWDGLQNGDWWCHYYKKEFS